MDLLTEPGKAPAYLDVISAVSYEAFLHIYELTQYKNLLIYMRLLPCTTATILISLKLPSIITAII